MKERKSKNDAKCSICDCVGDADKFCSFEEMVLCRRCYDFYVCRCDRCGEQFLSDYGAKRGEIIYCDDCFDECYFICDGCGRTVETKEVHVNDDRLYCDECYSGL